MKKLLPLLLMVVLFSSHDMFLKLDDYFLAPNHRATIQLVNGTFAASENVIDRNRMADVSLLGNGRRSQVDTTQWREDGNATLLDFTTGAAGTWVAGVSTRPRSIAMAAADFNEYLAHEGIEDMLQGRTVTNTLDQDAVEQYAKHVKTIFQVGDRRTEDWKTPLGYPIEFIPQANPYELQVGDELSLQLIHEGEPLDRQVVLVDVAAPPHSHEHASDHQHAAGADDDHAHDHDHEQASDHQHAAGADGDHAHDHDHEHAHDHEHDHDDGDDGHQHDDGHEHAAGDGHSHDPTEADHAHPGTTFRTDANGMIRIPITEAGIWNLRTIYLAFSEDPAFTHVSEWATLTFQVGEAHSRAHGADTHTHGTDTHTHGAENELGVPSWVFWLSSLVIVAGLFFWFNRKQ